MTDMRRFLLLAEHYNLMCLLLEGREDAVFTRFQPLVAHMVTANKMTPQDKTALVNRFGTERVEVELDMGDAVRKKLSVQSLILSFNPDQYTETGLQMRAEGLAHCVVKMIWDADPNPKKAYVTWMLTRYCAAKHSDHQLSLEDLDRTRGYLQLFDQVKNRLPQELKDINRFKSTNDLFDAIRDYRQDEGGQIVDQSYEKQMYAQAEIIYDSPTYRILIPKTQDAACYFGKGTEWCTAWVPPKTNNYFDHYNKQGPLYIVTQKSDGERWQFHTPSHQFMDVNDRQVNIRQWLQDHPEVDKAFNDYLGGSELEVIEPYDDRRSFFLSVREDGSKTLYVAENGWKPGGLISVSAPIEIGANADGRVIGTNCNIGLDDSKLSAFVRVLRQLGFHGASRWLNENDVIWDGEKYETFADLVPIASVSDMAVRKVGEDNTYRLHFSLTRPNGEITDDLCEIEVGRHYFTYKEQNRNVSVGDSNTYLSLFGRVLVEQLDENLTFEREDSMAQLPHSEELLRSRPQWLDLAYLYGKLGADNEIVQNKMVDWLSTTYENSEMAEVDGVKHVLIQEFDNIGDLIEDYGDETMKTIAKYMNGENHYEVHGSDVDISYQQTRLLKSLDGETFKKLCGRLASDYAEEMIDLDLDSISSVSDIETLMDEGYCDDLKSAMQSAVVRGDESGAESEMHRAYEKEIKNCPVLVFRNSEDKLVMATGEWNYDSKVYIAATITEIMTSDLVSETRDIEEESPDPYDGLLKALSDGLVLSEPYYGWSGHDDEVSEEAFGEEVSNLLD